MIQQITKVEHASLLLSGVPMGDSSAGNAPQLLPVKRIDKDFVKSAANILQTLFCLSHLTDMDANDPSKVRKYVDLTNDKLQAMSDLMRPMLWNPA